MIFSKVNPLSKLKVTKRDAVYAAISELFLRLILLTLMDVKKDSTAGLRIHDGEVYFRTKEDIYKISNEEDHRHRLDWILVGKNDKQKFILGTSDMFYGYLQIGERFAYGRHFTEEVTEIVVVTKKVIKGGANLEESKLVEEFYLKQ